MVLIENWLPPSRENWELVAWAWQFFPLLTAIQWLTDFYPQGKTSVESRFNLPGRYAWAVMESPGFLTVLYCMFTLPTRNGLTSAVGPLGSPLPWGNWTMAGLYTIHYIYRALLAPLVLDPSMSPIHLLIFLSAFSWQVINGISLGGWLAGYGPTTEAEWVGTPGVGQGIVFVGMVIWGWGFLGNMYHDDDLREIRRAALRRQKEEAKKQGKTSIEGVDKVYMLPENGLFRWVTSAHYLCEWIEWAGFWMIGGWKCVPARSFLLNEISTMLPRAIASRRWYIERFGMDRVGGRKAVIPGLI